MIGEIPRDDPANDPRPARSARFWALWTMASATVVLGVMATRGASPPKPERPAGPVWRPISVTAEPARRSRSIEEVKVGDLVMSRDDATGAVVPKRVVRLFRNTSDHLRLVRVRAGSGAEQTIETTDDHPFFVVGHGWSAARDLVPGDRLTQPDGEMAEVAATERRDHPEGVPVFNFEVEGTHNYFVARSPDDAFVLAHNECIRVKPGRQAPGHEFRISPDELNFVKNLLARNRKPNLEVYRTNQTERMGDFIVIDRSNPSKPVGWVVDVKMGGGARATSWRTPRGPSRCSASTSSRRPRGPPPT